MLASPNDNHRALMAACIAVEYHCAKTPGISGLVGSEESNTLSMQVQLILATVYGQDEQPAAAVRLLLHLLKQSNQADPVSAAAALLVCPQKPRDSSLTDPGPLPFLAQLPALLASLSDEPHEQAIAAIHPDSDADVFPQAVVARCVYQLLTDSAVVTACLDGCDLTATECWAAFTTAMDDDIHDEALLVASGSGAAGDQSSPPTLSPQATAYLQALAALGMVPGSEAAKGCDELYTLFATPVDALKGLSPFDVLLRLAALAPAAAPAGALFVCKKYAVQGCVKAGESDREGLLSQLAAASLPTATRAAPAVSAGRPASANGGAAGNGGLFWQIAARLFGSGPRAPTSPPQEGEGDQDDTPRRLGH